MSHQVLSRKYRPQRFDELRGQEHVSRILQNALSSGRVGHAYLLVGPRGVGKTTTARIFARALNCAERIPVEAGEEAAPAGEAARTVEPCGRCPSCIDVAAGSDLDVVEMDAASNNAVDDVRALREQVGYATVRSPFRIWIVDEVHMLSLPAFNAFLKTLEEPPPQVKFLFCTTEEHKLPDTFRSRCQRVEFRPIEVDVMAARLQELAARERVDLEEGVDAAIARGALGGLRDAESQLEQLIAARHGVESIRLADLDALSGRAPSELLGRLEAAVDAADASAALDAVDACLAAGSKPGVLVDQWLDRLRQQMVAAARAGSSPPGGPGVARLARAIDILLGKRVHLRAGAEGGLVLQVAAVELARLPDARDLDALIASLRDDDPGGGTGAPAAPGLPAAREGRGPGAPTPASAPPRRERPAQEAGGDTPSAHAGSPHAGSRRSASSPERPTGETLRACWPQVVAAAADRSPSLARALAGVRVGEVRGDAVLLHVPDEASAARALLVRKEIQLAFGQVLREVTGVYARPVIVDAPRRPTDAPPPSEDLRGHPSVQLVTEATGGRLVHVERAQPPRPANGGAAGDRTHA